jgi:hypothetical protein
MTLDGLHSHHNAATTFNSRKGTLPFFHINSPLMRKIGNETQYIKVRLSFGSYLQRHSNPRFKQSDFAIYNIQFDLGKISQLVMP